MVDLDIIRILQFNHTLVDKPQKKAVILVQEKLHLKWVDLLDVKEAAVVDSKVMEMMALKDGEKEAILL